ncbi:hypothetical protein, partial [Thiolapillus sp.]
METIAKIRRRHEVNGESISDDCPVASIQVNTNTGPVFLPNESQAVEKRPDFRKIRGPCLLSRQGKHHRMSGYSKARSCCKRV